jgi:hypothetical protein
MRPYTTPPLLTLLLSGCFAVAAGAGAAAGIYYSDRGAVSTVNASFEQVVSAVQRALPEMGVRVRKTERDDEDGQRVARLQGDRNDGHGEVEVKVKQDRTRQVEIEVVAKKSEVTWDKDFAGSVLEKILKYAGQ